MLPDLTRLDEERLVEWIADRRWFGAKSRSVAQAHVLDTLALTRQPPGLALAIVEARFPAGTHDLYQLPLAARPAAEGWDRGAIEQLGDQTVYDALADPDACALLAGLLRERASVGEEGGSRVEFHWLDGVQPPSAQPSVRAIGAEQSNSSVVIDEALVLKAFRRIEAGESPELEMLRFLSARDFPNIAELGGWYDYSGELMTATLGVVQRYVEGGRDGWELVLDGLERDPDALLDDLRALGAVVGSMHAVLASDATDPAFSPEEPSEEALPLMTATLDEQIERLFLDLPADDDRLEPIRGRGEEARDRLRLASHFGGTGRLIRHHGDFHLGQTLLVRPDRATVATPGGEDGSGDAAGGGADGAPRWVLLDFEGEPARPLLERRRKRSPLRDVAGLLRSLAYAVSAAQLQRGVSVPDAWEQRARDAFLAGYRETVEPTLLPVGEQATRTLLSILELEKAVYELRYELDHRPDWVPIPTAAIARLLEEPLEP